MFFHFIIHLIARCINDAKFVFQATGSRAQCTECTEQTQLHRRWGEALKAVGSLPKVAGVVRVLSSESEGFLGNWIY